MSKKKKSLTEIDLKDCPSISHQIAKLIWPDLLKAIQGEIPFTAGYFMDAEPVSFRDGVFTIGFRPEFDEHLVLVNNLKNKVLISAKIAQLGHAPTRVEFVKLTADGQEETVPETVPAPDQKADPIQAIIDDRSKVYGSPAESMKNIGLIWTGLIQQHYGIELAHPIPAEIVPMMLACFKMSRATRVFKQDNFDDGHAYMRFAEEIQGGKKP